MKYIAEGTMCHIKDISNIKKCWFQWTQRTMFDGVFECLQEWQHKMEISREQFVPKEQRVHRGGKELLLLMLLQIKEYNGKKQSEQSHGKTSSTIRDKLEINLTGPLIVDKKRNKRKSSNCLSKNSWVRHWFMISSFSVDNRSYSSWLGCLSTLCLVSSNLELRMSRSVMFYLTI